MATQETTFLSKVIPFPLHCAQAVELIFKDRWTTDRNQSQRSQHIKMTKLQTISVILAVVAGVRAGIHGGFEGGFGGGYAGDHGGLGASDGGYGGGHGGYGGGHGNAHSFASFHGPVVGPAHAVHVHGKHGHDHVDYVAHPHYEFAYGVEDHHTGDSHGQKESRDGDKVVGEYSLKEPGGNVRTVKYHSDHKGGFFATVHNHGGNDHSGYKHGKAHSHANFHGPVVGDAHEVIVGHGHGGHGHGY